MAEMPMSLASVSKMRGAFDEKSKRARVVSAALVSAFLTRSNADVCTLDHCEAKEEGGTEESAVRGATTDEKEGTNKR
jgi:hypothetical protein